MSRLLRRCIVALLALSTLAVATGCGNSETSDVTTAETEGIYLDLGGMKYQIQMSRYLNSTDPEDRDYLHGLPSGVQAGNGDVWFGIWMRVENDSDKPLPVATDYTITDTQKGTYRPVPLDAKSNPFAYQGGMVAPQSLYPAPDSSAANTPIQNGSLILFRIKNESLQNRPLILHITQNGKTDTATIDV